SPGPVIGVPSSRISPSVGVLSPPSRSSSVDLPQPLGPTSTTNSPRATSRENRSTAVNSVRRLDFPSFTVNFLVTPRKVMWAVTSGSLLRQAVELVGVHIGQLQLPRLELAAFGQPLHPGAELALLDHPAGARDAGRTPKLQRRG